MERRKAVTAAAAASVTFLLGAAGLTANATILGAQKADGVGQISPIPPTVPSAALAAPEKATTTEVATTIAPPAPKPQPIAAPPVEIPASSGPSGAGTPYPSQSQGQGQSQGSDTGSQSSSQASAPAPVHTTAPATTHSGGSPVATGTSGGGGEEVEPTEPAEHESGEHEGTDGSTDDD